MKPLIGITLDYEQGYNEKGWGYSRLPWYAMRENYCTAISDSGGVPLPLPHSMENIRDYMGLVRGLVLTGGAFDIDPALYGDSTVHSTVMVKQARTRFELEAAKMALAMGKPVLGICGGMQLLNVALGGTLVQHIPDEVRGALAHEQPNPRTEPGHSVNLEKGTRLAGIAGKKMLEVNSAHHQAVKALGRDLRVSGVAPDGVIEAIEHVSHPFCLGVQWHPEYLVSTADGEIFRAFVESCRL